MSSHSGVIFEAPASGPLSVPKASAGRENEPSLEVSEIQGNVFPGFSKDHQTLLFLRIDDASKFRGWLTDFTNHVATMEDVVAFGRMFKNLKQRQRGEFGVIRSTWLNIAFSFAGLKKLERPGMKFNKFADPAFKQGLLARSKAGRLGDPVASGRIGDPANWLIGGDGGEADLVVIAAADRRDELNEKVARIVAGLLPHIDTNGQRSDAGASVLFRQDGDILNGPLTGHEHFGFRDGVSQPGIRGLLADGTPLTPCQNPLDLGQGKPGQDLLWPGEFVFGYPGQSAAKDVTQPGLDPLKNPRRKAPEFARNGSFLVFRRLRQNVGRFHAFLKQIADRFQVTPDFVGAKIIGRWASGAPLVSSPQDDDVALSVDDCANNNFEFQKDDDGEPRKPAKLPDAVCSNVQPPSTDPDGTKAPFAAHIRKTYPRNDTSSSIPELGERSTQTHRLLRRGIPYGMQSTSTPTSPIDDTIDRGLLFLAYQTSIVEQFEFVTAAWANNPNFKDGGVGFDPIIGQNGNDPTRRRAFRLNLPGEMQPIETDEDWVVPTGGGYFFAPSVTALRQLAGGVNGVQPSGTKKAKRPRKK